MMGTFRKDINGLRAFAVIAVMLYHFIPEQLPGGFLGVDVFFVISGYLMTQIIVSKLYLHSFSYRQFYVARAKRILPALLVMCSIVLILGWFLLLDNTFARLANEVFHASILVSNIAYYQQAGYFDVSSLQKWLLHTWSLSVEWQFYLLYPIVLAPLYRYLHLNVIKLVILAATVLSFALAVYASSRWPSAAYYLLPTRAWEMLAGALIILYPWRGAAKFTKGYFYLSLITLVFACFAMNSNLYWPGIYTAIVVLSTYLFLQCQVTSILKWQPLQYIGSWSYSIYLWHWPIVVWIHKYYANDNYVIIATGLLLSIALGFISYQLIETRLRHLWHIALLAIITIIASLLIYFQQGHYAIRAVSQDKRNIEYNRYSNQTIDPDGWYKACNPNTQYKITGNRQVQPQCIREDTIGQGVFLWGDSHLGALSPGIRTIVPNQTPIYQVSSSTCQPSFEQQRQGLNSYAKSCNVANLIALKAIKRIKPHMVIMATARHHEQLDWLVTIKHLKSFGVKNIIIVGPVPQYDPSLPEVYLTRHNGKQHITDRSFRHSLIASNLYMHQLLTEVEGVSYIDVLGHLCQPDGNLLKCLVKPKDTLLSFDYGHLTVEGAIYISEKLLQPLMAQELKN